MKCGWLLIFICHFAFAQQKALEIEIDSVHSNETVHGQRKFVIYYHLANTADNPISLLLKPQDFSCISSGSLQNKPFYSIYENEKFMDLGPVFGRIDTNSKLGNNSHDWKEVDKNDGFPAKKQSVLNDLLTLSPHETKLYEIVFLWNKDPYFKNDDDEFFLDPNQKHYIEFTIISLQEQFKGIITDAEFDSLMKIPNFVTGVFTSNKMEINFSEQP
jgi:hypothetical protein